MNQIQKGRGAGPEEQAGGGGVSLEEREVAGAGCGGLPGIGEPGLRSDKDHIFINNMGEDNGRHSSTCRGTLGRARKTE